MSVDCPFSQSVQVAFLLAVPFLLCGRDGQRNDYCIVQHKLVEHGKRQSKLFNCLNILKTNL